VFEKFKNYVVPESEKAHYKLGRCFL